ncbi:MAG: purine-nucleoside phosphorylase [Nannocystaceae bacterium]
MDTDELSKVEARAREVLSDRLERRRVDWALICGSGIGAGIDRSIEEGGIGLQVEGSATLAELGLPVPEVKGHGAALVFGRVGEQRVCVQTGRIHPYEGHHVRVCTAALGAMLGAGARGVVLTCAVGAINTVLGTGELVSLRDQINLFGPTPLIGPDFVDCGAMYSPHLRERIASLAASIPSIGDPLREVVYIHARGPQYETPAETHALRRLGGDVVGMSTTYEAIRAVAGHATLCGIGVVTNVAGKSGLTHAEVAERGEAARGRLAALLSALLRTSPEDAAAAT